MCCTNAAFNVRFLPRQLRRCFFGVLEVQIRAREVRHDIRLAASLHGGQPLTRGLLLGGDDARRDERNSGSRKQVGEVLHEWYRRFGRRIVTPNV